MQDIFIKSIYIKEVRHLKAIEIKLDENERKHLILTGKNGSGKTSLLESIRSILGQIEIFEYTKESGKKIKTQKELILPSQSSTDVLINFISDDMQGVTLLEDELVIANFSAKRSFEVELPKGITRSKVSDQKNGLTSINLFDIDKKMNVKFVQHIVNLRADRSFAEEDGDHQTAQQIDRWFTNFENSLRQVFDDSQLKLQFDRTNYNYNIAFGNGNVVNFNQLPDGYSAIMTILTELILRMEKKSSLNYEIQGIVLIDEIESHLHIDLQKRILPFLTSFFPNIQFIVTTHSPFVINSEANAIVFDLEKQIKLENATAYSYDTLIESYFDSDKYSLHLKQLINEYESLLQKTDLNKNEQHRKVELYQYFKQVPTQFAPELAVKIQQFQLQELTLG